MFPALLKDKWILAATSLVVVFQLLYAFLADPVFNADGYLELGQDFNNYWQHNHLAATMRTPGYPLLLAAIYEAGFSDAGVKIVQIVFVIAGLLGLAAITKLTAGRRAARWCAWMFVLYIPLWSYSSIARTEAVAIPLLILAVLTLLLSEDRKRNRMLWLLATGALCGLAVIVRPNSLTPAAIILLVLLYRSFRVERSFARLAEVVLLLALPIVVIFGPWIGRNMTQEGSPDALGHNPFPLPLGVHMPYETDIGQYASFHRSYTFFSEQRSDGFTPDQALDFDATQVISENLRVRTKEFLATRAVAEFQMWPWPATPRVDYAEPAVVPYPLLMTYHVLILILGVIGLVKLRREPIGLIGLGIVGSLFLLHLVYVALPRYTLMAFPFLLVGAAIYLSGIWDSRRSAGDRAAAGSKTTPLAL